MTRAVADYRNAPKLETRTPGERAVEIDERGLVMVFQSFQPQKLPAVCFDSAAPDRAYPPRPSRF